MGPIVETVCGMIEGIASGDGTLVFRGIPYAEPPVGIMRFAAPSPRRPWSGVQSAVSFGLAPPQISRGGSLAMGEDCLSLNVWTPATDDGKRPVMVWIPGGGFTTGTGSEDRYDGSVLARRGDVVVVTTNYRLGAIGFAYLGAFVDENFPWRPNVGLLDQVAALEWVRDNIELFGGDPENVTIFGESAGGMAVVDLMAVPAAQGLFHRVIAQSGAADDVASVDEAIGLTSRLLAEIGLEQERADELSELPLEELLAAQQRCQSHYMKMRWGLSFRPVIDESVLPHHPRAAIALGNAADVPLIVGSTRDEWRFMGRISDAASFDLDWDALQIRLKEVAGPNAGRLYQAYREMLPDASPSDLWFAVETDRNFEIPAIWLAEVHEARRPGGTFVYVFTWPSPIKRLGSCHSIDVPFVFGSLDSPGVAEFVGSSPAAWRLAEQVQDAWIAFARTGNPNVSSIPPWSSYETDRHPTMLIGDAWEVRDDPRGGARSIWEPWPLRPISPSVRDLNTPLVDLVSETAAPK